MNELIAIQKSAGWEKLKTVVLDRVSLPIRSACTTCR